ncbi:MAG: NAD(P)/FAD-dependent oxidoreductase [Alphaproteobacteria bacterium]
MGGVVIIGAGQAGASCAITLRQMGFRGDITLLGDEPHPPYERPPLSKAALSTDMDIAKCLLRPMDFYQKHDIHLRCNIRVEKIDAIKKTITTYNKDIIGYDNLVIASGMRARRLDIADAVIKKFDKQNIFYMRSWQNSLSLRAFLQTPNANKQLVILGGGFIGLEVAASAKKLGWQVVIIEAEKRLMARATHPDISAWFLAKHIAEKNNIKLSTYCRAIDKKDHQLLLTLDKAGQVETILADGLLVGVGSEVNNDFIKDSELYHKAGIITDSQQATAVKHIYAIGDIAIAKGRFLADGVRLESVQNAVYGARACAAAISQSSPPRVEAPWFWSDQFDAKLLMAGLYDADMTWWSWAAADKPSISLVGMKDNIVRAVAAVNRPSHYAKLRLAIEQEKTIDPTIASSQKTQQEKFAMLIDYLSNKP